MAIRQVVLDTETTGLRPEDGHRIIEVGCVELLDRRITGNHLHFYLNPEREVEAGALAVHGITNEFLHDKPLFSAMASTLMDFIQGAELIIHNAPFDVGFINHELSLTRKHWKTLSDYCTITDTLPLARQMHVGQRNSLDALCKRYFIDNSKRDLHGALMDANLLARVYLAMTGGQGSFFDQVAESVNLSDAPVANVVEATVQALDLPIIYANEAELAAHAAYLEKIAKS
jgi:DNA polymerase-3 subunit epsilon